MIFSAQIDDQTFCAGVNAVSSCVSGQISELWSELDLYILCELPLQQTKRKLDDASKRLESLYDKLRDQAVS